MKKKYIVCSVFFALLMLVSTQVVFLDTAKGYPTKHIGEAHVGKLSITELNVTALLPTIHNIGIAHANATDDWVLWTNGQGNITANWSVNIGNKHPEYSVNFALYVFNVDHNNKEIGNASVTKTYGKNLSSQDSGSLKVAVAFNDQVGGNKTLICHLGSSVKINNTLIARNFTSLSEDRAVVPIELANGSMTLFKYYKDKANSKWPQMWSWIDNWEQHFSTENDMLNNQTYFNVGSDVNQYSGGMSNWYLGDLIIKIHSLANFTQIFIPRNYVVNWYYNYGGGHWAYGPCNISYTIYPQPAGNLPIIMHYCMICTEPSPHIIATVPKFPHKIWWPGVSPNHDSITAHVQAEDTSDVNHDNHIDMSFYEWSTSGVCNRFNSSSSYSIHISRTGSNTQPTGGQAYCWNGSCAYQNCTSITVVNQTIGGITYVKADITNILRTDNTFIYSYAPESHKTHIVFIC